MADEDKDLVSEVKIEGIEVTTDQLKKMGDDGADAFEKIGDAADNAGKKIAPAAKEVDKFTDSSEKAGRAAKDMSKDISAGLTNFDLLKIAATATGSALATFATRSAALGAALAASVVGIAKFASSTTHAYRELFEQQNRNVQQVAAQGKAQVKAVGETNQYNDALDDLTKQLAQGKIGYAEYGHALTALNEDFKRQEANIRRVQQAQEEAAKKNELAQRAEQQRVALKALTDMYGVELTGSLIKLGGAYKDVADEAKEAFGPGLSKLVDLISGAIDKNSEAISSFLDDAGEALTKFVEQNGPSIEKFFTKMIEVVRGLGIVITQYILPKLELIVDIADQIAIEINKAFGTELTGGILLAYVAITKLTGGLNLFMTIGRVLVLLVGSLITTFGILPVLIGAVAIALAAWLYTVDWAKLGADISAAFAAFIKFFTDMPAKIGAGFTKLWENIQAGVDVATTWVTEKWTAVVEFFSTIVGQIGQFFIDLWEGVKQKAQDAFDYVAGIVQGWVNKVLGWLKPILDLIDKIKKGMADVPAGGGGGDTVTAAGGGHIRGAGTSTSDSILARLSNNEYVIRARAVAKYGVGFMNAVNSGRFKMPQFAMGGLNMIAPSPSARFSGEERPSASNMRPLDLTLFGETFEGLMMPDDVAGRMTKFAISRQTRSAGRKPSWVGGTR